MRRGLARLGLLLIAAVLSLVALELAMWALEDAAANGERWRTRGLHRADPDLVYAMRPSSFSEWSTAEFVERAHTNSIGLRGPELSPDDERRPRVLILGDSMTYGHGVGDTEAYPARLATRLAASMPDADVEVVNAGVKGYGTDHSYRFFLQRLRALRPRVVVFALNYNDYEDNLRYPLYRVEQGRLVALDATEVPLYRVARASERLPDAVAELRVVRAALRLVAGRATTSKPSDDDEAGLLEAEQRKVALQLRRLGEIAREDGFALLVVGLPFRDGRWDPFSWLSEPLRGVAPLLDLSRDPTWQRERDRWFFRTDEHLSAEGHARVARALHRFIEQRGWLAPPAPPS